MNDDIVKYLRVSQTRFNRHAEAADEIERLRKLSNELLEALTEMADKEMLPKITIRLRDTAQALEQAVRGD